MQDFFHMSGYAAYIWPAYVIVLVILLGNFVSTLLRRKKILEKIEKQDESTA